MVFQAQLMDAIVIYPVYKCPTLWHGSFAMVRVSKLNAEDTLLEAVHRSTVFSKKHRPEPAEAGKVRTIFGKQRQTCKDDITVAVCRSTLDPWQPSAPGRSGCATFGTDCTGSCMTVGHSSRSVFEAGDWVVGVDGEEGRVPLE